MLPLFIAQITFSLGHEACCSPNEDHSGFSGCASSIQGYVTRHSPVRNAHGILQGITARERVPRANSSRGMSGLGQKLL
jgi:hypothetical protein